MIIENTASTRRYKELSRVLGRNSVSSKVESPFDYILIADKGVQAAAVQNFRKYFNLPRGFTADILNISEPTLYRWIKSNRNLERNFSIKLFETAELFLYGIEVFESRDNFFKWLNLPNSSLGGYTPQELIEIPGGISKVKDVLGRIEYGVYS